MKYHAKIFSNANKTLCGKEITEKFRIETSVFNIEYFYKHYNQIDKCKICDKSAQKIFKFFKKLEKNPTFKTTVY